MITSLLAAFTFLTRLPLPAPDRVDADVLARSAVWFPLVGAVVGERRRARAGRCWPALAAPVAAALSLMVTVLLTGAFHEDALADAADGLGGGRDRERMLEIMRDSRIGSYGAVALVLVLVARLGCLAELTTPDGARALVGAHVLGAVVQPAPDRAAAIRPRSGCGQAIRRRRHPDATCSRVPCSRRSSWRPRSGRARSPPVSRPSLVTALAGLFFPGPARRHHR